MRGLGLKILTLYELERLLCVSVQVLVQKENNVTHAQGLNYIAQIKAQAWDVAAAWLLSALDGEKY